MDAERSLFRTTCPFGPLRFTKHRRPGQQRDQSVPPVPGANDAASGVAVLLELARHIPSMDLGYDVVLFFNDAEDQNHRYTLGAEAWAQNLTTEEIASTHAFVFAGYGR